MVCIGFFFLDAWCVQLHRTIIRFSWGWGGGVYLFCTGIKSQNLEGSMGNGNAYM
jgi:hypothetical protein